MRSVMRLAWAAACLTYAGLAQAADEGKYPSRAIHIVVGFTPGGGNDIIARVVGQKLSESVGQPVIIENKPGAGAMLATEYVAKAAPDGYTLLVGASGAMVVNPAVYRTVNYDTLRDFVPVSELGSFPLILIVNAKSPYKSVADLVAFAKSNPGEANYSSSSASFQLTTELFKQKTGAPMQMIPYKGANDSVQAVISGEVTATIADSGPVLSQVTGGTVRPLAVSTSQRLEELPDVPTMKEAGADVEVTLWSGVFVPKATSLSIVKKLQDEFARIMRLPDVVSRFRTLGIKPAGSSSEEFTSLVSADLAKWSAVARSGNIRLDQ